MHWICISNSALRLFRHSNRATNAPYTINDVDGPTLVTVDQQTDGGAWVSLGVFNFDVGSASVVLSDAANGVVIADAIRIVPANPS